jgi:hypothetical protein
MDHLRWSLRPNHDCSRECWRLERRQWPVRALSRPSGPEAKAGVRGVCQGNGRRLARAGAIELHSKRRDSRAGGGHRTPFSPRQSGLAAFPFGRACKAVLLAGVQLFGGYAYAQTVTDGDTIKLDGTTYRIWGIDAAEKKQACADGWMAGEKATAAMLGLVRGRKITCEARVTDRYGRPMPSRPRW